jgi:hypothetical protein
MDLFNDDEAPKTQEEEEEEEEDRECENLEIVMELSIRDPRNGDAEPTRFPPVSVTVDRRTLSHSPVQVKIGVQGGFN